MLIAQNTTNQDATVQNGTDMTFNFWRMVFINQRFNRLKAYQGAHNNLTKVSCLTLDMSYGSGPFQNSVQHRPTRTIRSLEASRSSWLPLYYRMWSPGVLGSHKTYPCQTASAFSVENSFLN